MRPLKLVAVCASFLSACAPGQDAGRISFALETGPLAAPLAEPGDPMLDEMGVADLSLFPLFLVLTIAADDLPEPIVAVWPESVPESAEEIVVLDIPVDAGTQRRISLELLVAEADEPAATFVSPPPGEASLAFDVEPGAVVDVDIVPVELPTGTVVATWDAGDSVEALAWVDEGIGAVLPPVLADGEGTATTLAVGRSYWPRLIRSDGTTVDLDAERTSLDTEGQTLSIHLDIP